MSEYDVVVLGAGPGGYVAAIRASQLGLKTAIIDKEWLGGVCLNVGCIPSKSLLKNADVANTLRTGAREFGFSFENLKLDYSVAVKRSRQVSNRLTKGVGFLMKKNNIDVIMGTGRITDKNKLSVTGEDGKTQEIVAKNIIVATGAYSSQNSRCGNRWRKDIILQRSNSTNKTTRISNYYRGWCYWCRICDHLEWIWHRCYDCRDATTSSSLRRRRDWYRIGKSVQESRH